MCGTLILTHEDLYKQKESWTKNQFHMLLSIFFWKKTYSLVWLHTERKSCDRSIIGTGDHVTSQPPSHEHDSTKQGQMLPHCSGYVELNLRGFCCSFSHWIFFFPENWALWGLSQQLSPDRCQHHLRKLQWVCLEVVGSGCSWRMGFGGPWTWAVCLISASNEGLFCAVSASRCLNCVICQLIWKKKSTNQNPNEQLQNNAGFYWISLLPMKSELTAGSCGDGFCLGDFLISFVFFKG